MEDSLQLRKDGTIRMVIADKTYRLRQPTLGEVRKRHALWKEQVVELDASEGRSDEAVEDAVIGWLQETITLLSDAEPFVMSDDLPPWVGSGALGSRFVNHWRSFPLVSGG